VSRSNHITEPRRAPKMEQPDLVPDAEPQTVTVDGTGLLTWCRRDAAGEVHIYRMISKRGIYVISLTWLHGRRLYGYKDKAV